MSRPVTGQLTRKELQELRRLKAVRQALDEWKKKGFDVDKGTLYPLLRRLEERGLLESDWVVDDPRPRKYYRINSTGSTILSDLKTEWDALVQVLEGVLS